MLVIILLFLYTLFRAFTNNRPRNDGFILNAYKSIASVNKDDNTNINQ